MKKLKVYKGFVYLAENAEDLKQYLQLCKDDSLLTFDWETTGLAYNCTPLGLALNSHGRESLFCPIDYFFTKGLPMKEVASVCNKEFKRLRLIAHNAKFDSMVNIMNGIKDESCNIVADTLIMIHLVNPILEKQLEGRVKEDFDYAKPTFEEIITEHFGRKRKWTDVDWANEGDELLELLARYAGEDAFWETQVYNKYKNLLDEDAWNVLNKIEMPMVNILRDAKIRGVLIDIPLLEDFGSRAQEALERAMDAIYDEAGCIFNINSSKQKREVFFDKLKLPIISSTKTGEPSTDADSAEEWAEMGYPIGEALVKYSELNKLITGYINSIPQLVDKENVLRGDLNSCGTRTGRMCIEEHQRVMTVGGLKMIKDVKVGDLVYCYDNNGKVRIRKVLNVWNKGFLPLVRVKYLSSGDNKVGEILCTANHSFLTKSRGWVMAKDLMREKVYHLRRSYPIVQGKVRPRLYGTNSFMEYEQETIKREYFCSSSDMHIHHKNGVTSDNSIENLEVLSHEEHSRVHLEMRIANGSFKRFDPTGVSHPGKKGEEHPMYIRKGKFELLRMLFVAGGRPTKVPMDFDTYKGKCTQCGIDLNEVCKRFNGKGEYISRVKVEGVADMPVRMQQKILGLGYYRVNELMEYYGVTNHLILSVKRVRGGVCYDIEVDEFNNFICEELCVHNSSSNPNLQNQPNNKDFPIRSAFIPRPGYVFINYDYSQLELRVMAHMSKDEKFRHIFETGGDPHGDVAKRCGLTRKQAKCVNSNTLIYTDKGVVRIGDVSSCRRDDTFDAPLIKKVYNGSHMIDVNSFYSNGVHNTLGVITKRGIVRCSEEHKFLLTDGQLKRATDLEIGDELVDNSPLRYEGEKTVILYNPFFDDGDTFSIEMDSQWAYIAGVLTGDGCFSQKHIGVAAGSGRFFKAWRETLKNEFAKKGLPLTSRSDTNYLYLGSSRFVKFMIPFGLSDERGVKNFKIPMWVLNGSIDMRKNFLGGLIDTDGTIDESGTTSICTKSIQLAEDLCFLLNSIRYDYGVECSWNKTYERYYYRIHIYSTSLTDLLNSSVIRCPHKVVSLTERVAKIGKGASKKPNKVLQVLSLGQDYLCDLNVDSEDHLYMTGTLVTHNTMNFGVLYGMGPDKYERTFGVTRERAIQMIDDYHKTYDGFARWKTSTENFAKKNGYVKNLFGRKRILSEAAKNSFSSGFDKRRYFGELRQSVNCVDTETEIFTKRGWLRYDEVHEGDIALTYNGDKDIMEWQPILQVVRMPYVGDMVSMEGEAHSSLSTPNHRWFVRDGSIGPCVTRDSEFIFNMSKKGSYRFPLCANIISDDNPDFSDEWLELFGVFITDGFHESLHQIGLCQSTSKRKEGNIERIGYLISKVGDEVVRERDHSWGKYEACHYWTLRGEFTEWCKIVTNQMKRVTDKSWLCTLSQRQASKLLDGIILGDGYKSNSCKTVYIGNIHKCMIDFYAEVALLAGKSYGISVPGKDAKNRDYVLSIKSRGNVYCGLLERKKVHYNGIVWCPRVENQSFLMRRNDKVCITRNTIIQGTGADIVKRATIDMCRKFKEADIDAHFLLQVHDEVLVEARIDQALDAEKFVIEAMQNSTKLCVPLLVDGKIIQNWGEMKSDDIPTLFSRFDYSLYGSII